MPSLRLSFYQEIQDAIAEEDRLVFVVGPHAVASEYVCQEWMFALEADKFVNPILRVGDFPIIPDELKLLHCEDFRIDDQFEFHLANLVRQLRQPPPPRPLRNRNDHLWQYSVSLVWSSPPLAEDESANAIATSLHVDDPACESWGHELLSHRFRTDDASRRYSDQWRGSRR